MSICQPDNRNIYGKIFGGYIMRQAFELAWANSFVFCKSRPRVLHMDDILFRSPVEIGAMLYFNSQVCFTQGNYVQIRVSAETLDPVTGKMAISTCSTSPSSWSRRRPPSSPSPTMRR